MSPPPAKPLRLGLLQYPVEKPASIAAFGAKLDRWLAEARGRADEPRLEEKLKRGAVSGKRSHPLPAVVLNGNVLNGPLEATFGAAFVLQIPGVSLGELRKDLRADR